MLFLVKGNSSNKRHIGTVALIISGRHLFTFLSQMQRLFKGGAYFGAELIRVNTVVYVSPISCKLAKQIDTLRKFSFIHSFISPSLKVSLYYLSGPDVSVPTMYFPDIAGH